MIDSTDENNKIWDDVISKLDEKLLLCSNSSHFQQTLNTLHENHTEEKNKLQSQIKALNKNYSENELKEKLSLFNKDAHLFLKKIDDIAAIISDFVDETENEFMNIRNIIKKIQMSDKCHKYLTMISWIEEQSFKIESSLLINDPKSAVSYFVASRKVIDKIEKTTFENLKNFSYKILKHWFYVILTSLKEPMEKEISFLNWPLISSNTKVSKSSMSPLDDMTLSSGSFSFYPSFLESLIEQLSLLQLPKKYKTHDLELFPGSPTHPISLSFQLFLLPFQKRFNFHFYGNQKTNSVEKPEWYMTQLIIWIRDHRDLLFTCIQPLFNKANHSQINVFHQFIHGLSHLANEKLSQDFSHLIVQQNDQLLAHHIDECINFYKETSQYFPYSSFSVFSFQSTSLAPSSLPDSYYFGGLEVLIKKKFFQIWITLERDYALKKMDLILSSPEAWITNSLGKDQMTFQKSPDTESHPYFSEINYKTPQFAEQFLILLATILDKYKHLPNFDCILQFHQLHLELLDNFRIRLHQIKKESFVSNPLLIENLKFFYILNIVSFITDVMTSWKNKPFFAKLIYEKKKLEKLENKKKKLNEKKKYEEEKDDGLTPFDGLIELYENMMNEMLNSIQAYVLSDFQTHSSLYQKDKWFKQTSNKIFLSQSLSNSACPMLKSLKINLVTMETHLSKHLFEQLWQSIAKKLDQYIFNEIILGNHFNEGGASQFSFDMSRNLFPIFSFSSKPDSHFKLVKEACKVLTLSPGSSLLIKDLLKKSLSSSETGYEYTDPIIALQEIGVWSLEPEQVWSLISLRVDLV